MQPQVTLPDQPSRLRVLSILLAVLAAAAPLAFFLDLPLARWIQADGLTGDVKHVVRLSEVFAHGSGVFLILLAVISLDARRWWVLPRLAIGAYGAGLLADLLKLVMSRRRPEKFDVNLTVWDSFLGFFAWSDASTWREALSRDIQSFPSGHAATAAGLACALSRLYPRASWFFVAITVLACFQRIAAMAHYLSDVLAGAFVGVLVNLLLELPRVRKWLASFENEGF
jgi:membrane-associated phospholipid phosphatase